MKEPRHRARETALQFLYQVEARSLSPEVWDSELSRHFEHFQTPDALQDFARSLAAGTLRKRAEIDALLAPLSSAWKLERMPAIDRNCLRLGAFELAFASERLDTPIVIDEAVELARRFGGPDSPAFVNGVLDALARQISQERETASKG